MKKTYMQPLTEVVKLNVGEMLQAVSGFGNSLNPLEDKTPGSGALNIGDEEYDDFDW